MRRARPCATSTARDRGWSSNDLLRNENKALGSTYAKLRGRLQDIAEGRSGRLPIEQVAAFTRFYREHMLRAESVLVGPVSPASSAASRLDS